MNPREQWAMQLPNIQIRLRESGTYEWFNYANGVWLDFCPMPELVTLVSVLDATAGYQDADDVEIAGVGVRGLINITTNAGRSYSRYWIYSIRKEALKNAACTTS